MPPQPSDDPADQPLAFGVFDWVDARPGVPAAAVYDGRLEMLRAADRGQVFSTYHVAEHHGTPLGTAPSPAVYLAAAARVTDRIRLAPTTFVVPLYDPLRLVQEIAMLDQLSHGRLDVGLGPGAVPLEGLMYGNDPQAMRAGYEQRTPALLEALTTGVLRSPDPGARPDVELPLTTVQQPHPPLWYPTVNAGTVPRLGTEGWNTLFGFAWLSPPPAEIGEASRVYVEHFQQARRDGGPRYAVPGRVPRFGTMKHVFVARTDEEAVATARGALLEFNASFTHLWRQQTGAPAPMEMDVDFDELRATARVLVGSPDTVASQLAELVTVGRLNYFTGVFAWGSLEPEATLSSMELFTSDVVPSVRAAAGEQAAEVTASLTGAAAT